MQRTLGAGILFLAVALLIPTEARGQKKGKGDGATQATPHDYAQLAQLKEVVGTLVYAESSAQSLTLRLDYQRIEANPKFKPAAANKAVVQQLQRIVKDEARILKEKNAIKRQQLMRQLVRDVNRLQQQPGGVGKGGNLPYRVVTDSKDFELGVDDKASVRWQNPPLKLDDEGIVIKYTKEQLDELKGKDKSKPGYRCKFEELVAGQVVKLYLKASGGKAAKEDADAVASRPSVTMILILQDNSNSTFRQDQDQGKKKKK